MSLLPNLGRFSCAAPLPSIVAAVCAPATAAHHPPSADWRQNIRAFAETHLQHTAWGPAHGRRDYMTTLALARAEGITVDTDALYAAAYLHDMGGLPPYAI